MKKRKPYDGITGFMDNQETLAVLESVPQDYQRLIMIGVLVSSKTLRGIPNKWVNRYPLIDKVESVFAADKRTLGLVHYNTDTPEHLFEEMLAITIKCMGSTGFNGFQLNVAWPDPSTLKRWRDNDMSEFQTIVLQIGGKAFAQVNHSPQELAKKIVSYGDTIDYLLLDPSGGLGQEFDPQIALGYLRALRDANTDIGLGVAGGLSSSTLHLLEPIIAEFPDVSIDAEGKLRTTEDHLDLNKSIDYLNSARKLFA